MKKPFKKAISLFSKHGLEKATAQLKVAECKAVLTLGFGTNASGKLADLQRQLGEEIAKGRSECHFWKSLGAEGEREDGSGDGGNLGGEPRGPKRIREDENPQPSPGNPQVTAPTSGQAEKEMEVVTPVGEGSSGDPNGRKRSREETDRTSTPEPSPQRQRVSSSSPGVGSPPGRSGSRGGS